MSIGRDIRDSGIKKEMRRNSLIGAAAIIGLGTLAYLAPIAHRDFKERMKTEYVGFPCEVVRFGHPSRGAYRIRMLPGFPYDSLQVGDTTVYIGTFEQYIRRGSPWKEYKDGEAYCISEKSSDQPDNGNAENDPMLNE